MQINVFVIVKNAYNANMKRDKNKEFNYNVTNLTSKKADTNKILKVYSTNHEMQFFISKN